MILAAETEATYNYIVPVPSFDGVTMALMLFIFACALWPKTVKDRPQFIMAVWVTVAVMVIHVLRMMLYDWAGVQVFGAVLMGILQVGAFILLFLSAGGTDVGQFFEETRDAIAVVRRGGESKEVIVPLKGEMPKQKDDPGSARRIYTIDDASPAPAAPPPPPPKPDANPDNGPLPLS